MADFREMMACLEQVPKAHPPIAVGNALAHVACRDRLCRQRRSVHRPPGPSAEGNKIPPVVDRWAELIRRQRQFNLPQPDRSQRAGDHPDRGPQPDREQRYRGQRCHSAQPNCALPFCSIARRWPVTRPSVDGISLLGRDLAVHQPPLRANTRGCIAIDLNHNPVMLASEQRQPSVPAHECRCLDPRAEVRGSNFAIILSNQPVVPSEPLASSGVYRPVAIGA